MAAALRFACVLAAICGVGSAAEPGEAEPGEDDVADVVEAVEDRGPGWVRSLAFNVANERETLRSDFPSLSVRDWEAMGGHRGRPLPLGAVCLYVLEKEDLETLRPGLLAVLERVAPDLDFPHAIRDGDRATVEWILKRILPRYHAAKGRNDAEGVVMMHLMIAPGEGGGPLPRRRELGDLRRADLPPGVKVERLAHYEFVVVEPALLAPLAEKMLDVVQNHDRVPKEARIDP